MNHYSHSVHPRNVSLIKHQLVLLSKETFWPLDPRQDPFRRTGNISNLDLNCFAKYSKLNSSIDKFFTC